MNVPVDFNVAMAILLLRHECGITQTFMAEYFETSKRMITTWKNGQSEPRLRNGLLIMKLASERFDKRQLELCGIRRS